MKSNGNPIEMDLSTRYVVKGIGKEQKINSKIQIWTEGDKIVKVADKCMLLLYFLAVLTGFCADGVL